MRTLALDLSSTCVGYAVFENLDLYKYGKFLQKGKDHGEKFSHFAPWLLAIYELFQPDNVLVELPHGGNRGRAFEVLTQYVAVVLLTHFQFFQKELPDSHRLYPTTIKAQLKVVSAKDHDKNKAIMVERINGMFDLALYYSPYEKSKLKNDDDIADAIALGVAWLLRTGQDDGRYAAGPNRRAKRTRKAPARRS